MQRIAYGNRLYKKAPAMNKSVLRGKLMFCILISMLSLAFMSCEDKHEEEEIIVRYGTSFGECIGYCRQQITISDETTIYLKQTWDNSLPDVKLNVEHSENAKESLFDAIDIDAFTDLASVIGCPDCADGGAEWIEIEKGDIHHKVTFEYFNNPETLNAYIGTLRMILTDAQKQQ